MKKLVPSAIERELKWCQRCFSSFLQRILKYASGFVTKQWNELCHHIFKYICTKMNYIADRDCEHCYVSNSNWCGNHNQCTEAWTKCLLVCKRYSSLIFLCLIQSYGFQKPHISIGNDNWQAIIGTNAGLVYWRIYASHGLVDLRGIWVVKCRTDWTGLNESSTGDYFGLGEIKLEVLLLISQLQASMIEIYRTAIRYET